MSPGRILAAAAAGLVMLLLCTAGLASCGLSLTGTGLGCDHRQDCPAADALARFDDEQVTNAALIVSVGARLRVPPWGQVIAVATAIQESSLRNLGHGDRDSLGLFQQRPSQGWGTPEQLTDPDHAAEAFYRALLSVPRWETMPLTEAAQAVQRSAHPDAYARWSGDAAALVTALTGTTTDGGGGGWTRPVHAPVVSTFRSPQRPTHQGTDLAAPRHTIIAAAAAGTVATVACNAHHHDGRPWGCHRDGHPRLTVGCGWYVDITHPDAVTTRYCHLQTEPWVNVGDPVVAGQPIGLVGSTGHSSGPHLHYEVHVAGAPVDPQIWMREHGAPL